MVKRVAVTGANGFVGSACCAYLRAQGVEVVPLTREHISLDTDIDIRPHLTGVDAIVHCAARVHVLQEDAENPAEAFVRANTEATRLMAQQAEEKGVKRFVFLSSIGVLGNRTAAGAPFDENTVPRPHSDYARSKWLAEHYLQEHTKMQVVILRPPLVYGAGVKANFLKLLKAVDARLPLPLRSIHAPRDFLYVQNLCEAIHQALTVRKAAGQTINLCDGEAIGVAELVRALATYMHKTPVLLPCPEMMLRVAGKVTGKKNMIDGLCNRLEIDNQHATRILQWTPGTSLQDGLKETVAWYKTQ